MNFLDFSNDAVQTGPYDIPAGMYVVECVLAELKDNKSNTGKLVKVKLKVTGGECKGKSVYHQFNVQHTNEQAQQIGRSEMKSMLVAMGMSPTLQSVTELVGKLCMVKINREKDRNGEERSAVKGFHSMGAGQTPAPTGF